MWKHNTFGDIINEEGDFVGYVAYSLYKQQKIKWIHNFKEKTGAFPTSEQVEDYFNSFHSSTDCINKYREDAERMLNEYFEYSFAEELQHFKNSIKEEAIVKAVHKPFWQVIRENVVAGIIASLITASLSVCLWLYSEMKSAEQRADFINRFPIAEELKKILEETKQLP